MAARTIQDIHGMLKERFAERAGTVVEDAKSPWIELDRENVIEICTFLNENDLLDFDLCHLISGVDYGWEQPPKPKKKKDEEEGDAPEEPKAPKDRGLGVTYHLYSSNQGHMLTVKVLLDRESPSVPSVDAIWPAANWHERETYDMLGILFEGSRDLRRILLPPDWEGFPLRKDYDFPEHYQGYSLI